MMDWADEIARGLAEYVGPTFQDEVSEMSDQFATALRKAKADGEPQWQPIETAPKDGSSILVARVDGFVCEVDWKDNWYGDKSNPGWMIANCDEEYGAYVNATHWMPLPKPPK